MYDNHNIRNYVVTIFNKKTIIKRYQTVIVKGIQYIFLGIFDTDKDVPNVTCCYIVSDKFKTKLVQLPHITKKCNTKIADSGDESDNLADNTLLRISVDKEDDELMVIMKSVLIKRGITVGQFKRLYGEENKTDMNNDKSRLENKHTLSWNKFKFILNLLNHEYRLIIFDN